jgi:hypothetical protein
VTELTEPAEGLWTFHQELSVLGAEIGTRMTLIRLESGELLVHSPIKLTEALRRRVDEVGPVAHVLAPNRDHNLFVRDFKLAYPAARFYAAPGVAEKLPDVRFDVELAYPATIEAWEGTVDQAYFRSSEKLQELVLFHRATKTLVTADLAFNVQSTTGKLSQVMLRLNDSYRSFGPSRVCRSHITDRATARSDVDAILGWSAERVIVAHGEILRSGATEAIRRGYAWLR